MATFRVDVDTNGVSRKIRRRIEDGIDSGADEIGRHIESVAKGKIRREGAVWRHELLEGFNETTLEFGDRTVVSVINVSDHASPQEHGVSGTAVRRDTPHSYTTQKPPLEALIPWVRDHLTGTGFNPTGPSSGSGTSVFKSGGSNDDDGVEVTSDEHNPLMGADQLDTSSTGLIVNHPNRGILAGSVNRVIDNDDYDYELDIDNDGNYISIKQEWITNFDGRGADPGAIEVGQEVYFGSTNSVGTIVSVDEDSNGDVIGAYVDFNGDGNYDDLLDPFEFEIVHKDGLAGVQEDAILTDENNLYVPGTNFRHFDRNSKFELELTHPNQRIVVWDGYDSEYRRAKITGYPDEEGSNIQIKFDDDGGITKLDRNQTGKFKLVGGEFWDSLTESEKKDRLRTHFDDNIRDEYKDGEMQTVINSGKGLTAPSKDRLDWVRDNWLTTVWDDYQDDWYIKEQFRGMHAQLGSDSTRVSDGNLAGVAPISDGDKRYITLFWSKQQVSNKAGIDEAQYLETLQHESAHGLSASTGFDRPGEPPSYSDIYAEANWQKNGLQTKSDPNLNLPSDAKLQMFHDVETTSSDPIGGTGWIEDAYHAAQGMEVGIKGYSPTFQTPKNQPLKRLHEAVNHVYWLQTVAGREKYKTGALKKEDRLFVNWKYSGASAPETLATFHEVMVGQDTDIDDIQDRIEMIHKLYPWLIEAWLEVGTPSDQAADKLRDLGYNV